MLEVVFSIGLIAIAASFLGYFKSRGTDACYFSAAEISQQLTSDEHLMLKGLLTFDFQGSGT
ncbi:MAG TPA: hypothetical protein V6D14_26030 [Coleofasciculaceae cyanobacterium]